MLGGLGSTFPDSWNNSPTLFGDHLLGHWVGQIFSSFNLRFTSEAIVLERPIATILKLVSVYNGSLNTCF